MLWRRVLLSWLCLWAALFAVGTASARTGVVAQTRIGAFEHAAALSIWTGGAATTEEHRQNSAVSTTDTSGDRFAPGGGVGRVATEPDTAFFWSGRTNGVGGEHLAAEIASARGGTTLEMLVESRGIRLPKWDPKNPASIRAWQEVSAEFAAGASGDVRAVIGKNLRPGNVWENVELLRLRPNTAVRRTITIDPATQVERTIFRRLPVLQGGGG